MLAIGTRAAASCCASTSPVALLATTNARASTSGGVAACAGSAATSTSATRATVSFTVGRLLDADLLADRERRRADSGVQLLELLHGRPVRRGDRAVRIAGLDRHVLRGGRARRRRAGRRVRRRRR